MSANNTRILTSFLTTMAAFLLWLIAFVFKESIPGGQIQKIAPGDVLVLTILFIAAISLAGIIIVRLVPNLFEIQTTSRIRFWRGLLFLAFLGIILFGLIS